MSRCVWLSVHQRVTIIVCKTHVPKRQPSPKQDAHIGEKTWDQTETIQPTCSIEFIHWPFAISSPSFVTLPSLIAHINHISHMSPITPVVHRVLSPASQLAFRRPFSLVLHLVPTLHPTTAHPQIPAAPHVVVHGCHIARLWGELGPSSNGPR